MNIIYGVSGEGFGHATHAIAIASYLEKKGHKVVIITYGKAYDVLKDKFKTFLVNGLYMDCKNGKINPLKTLFSNSNHFIRNFSKIKKIKNLIKNFKPEICISDMEPFSAWISIIYKLPLISISNQNRFVHYKLNIPKKYKKDYFLLKTIIKIINPKSDYKIALSLCKLEPKNLNSFIVAPIIKEEIKKIKPSIKDKIVVYLSKENPRFIETLKQIKENFVIFPYEKERKEANLFFRKKENFLNELKDCKAIISNAGFTSVGEAIYLKKPYLAIPLKGQFEQVFNSIYIEKKGFGKFLENGEKQGILEFIKNINIYSKNLKKNKKQDYDILFDILDNILKKHKG
ncbi:hypothetical protein J4218_01190 [Candidatus Pacearchaeota archaeon]|nr:hypothetical protein [Candidatus Pacearchaeota archaeon]